MRNTLIAGLVPHRALQNSVKPYDGKPNETIQQQSTNTF